MTELEEKLCKLIMNPNNKFGWVDNNNFYVCIKHTYVRVFIKKLKNIFGCELFDNRLINSYMRSHDICINLSDLTNNRINIENKFPKHAHPLQLKIGE